VVLAALTASPAAAFLIAVLFGTVRGLAVLLGARITGPDELFAFHRRFDRFGPVARLLVIAVEGAVAFVTVASSTNVALAVAITVALAAGFVGARAKTRVRAISPSG
jgi:hypothetical protein